MQTAKEKTINISSKALLLPAIALLIGTVTSTGFASNAYAEEDNEVNRDIDVKHTNSCDEEDAGDNNAFCRFNVDDDTGDINVDGQNNEVNSDVSLKYKNDCDESGSGDNNADCRDLSSTTIGDINIPP